MTHADPTTTGLSLLLVSLAVLVIFYNIFTGWRNGVVRQICRVIAIVAGYLFGALLGPMIAPLLTFVHWPPAGVKALACIGVGLLVYLILKIVTNILFRKTSEQESGFVRFFYGLGGALIGLLFSAVFLLFAIASIRMTGTVGQAQMTVAEKRHEKISTGRNVFLTQLVRAKKTLETGPAGPVLKAIDPTPNGVYVFLDKLGRVSSDPDAMRRLMDFPGTRQIMNQPALRSLSLDPIVQKEIQDRDYAALFGNSKVIAALKDENLRPQLQKFELGHALDFALKPAALGETPAVTEPTPTPPPAEQY